MALIQQAETQQVHGAGSGPLHRSVHQESHHRAAILRQRHPRASGKPPENTDGKFKRERPTERLT